MLQSVVLGLPMKQDLIIGGRLLLKMPTLQATFLGTTTAIKIMLKLAMLLEPQMYTSCMQCRLDLQ